VKREQVSEIFYQCIERMEQGESIESCLASYPEQLEYLAPLLRAAAKSRNLDPHSRLVTKAGGSDRVGAVIESLQEKAHPGDTSRDIRKKNPAGTGSDSFRTTAEPVTGWTAGWDSFRLAARSAVLIVLVVVLTSLFTLTASASNSLPGERLYPLKRGVETARLTLAVNEQTRSNLEARFQERRLEEIQALMAQGLSAQVDFHGILGEKSREVWTISGLQVTVGDRTVLSGELEDGEEVKVDAVTLGDGRVVAEEITAAGAADPGAENPDEPAAADPGESEVLGDQDQDDRDDDDRDDDDRDDDRDDDDRDDDGRDDDDRDDDRDDDDRDDDDRDDDDRDDDDRDDDDRDDDDRDDEDRDEDQDLLEGAQEKVPDLVEEKVPDAVEEKIPGGNNGQAVGKTDGKKD
jgi:hypothetical protein